MTEPNPASGAEIDFKIDENNLYRDESFTDMKTGAIRRLTPVKADGGDDTSRTEVFIGSTQLITPDGPLPLQAMLKANNLGEALEVFPAAMKNAMNDTIEKFKEMREQQQQKGQGDSRIIVPGRG
jgi:hypothetical protein